MKTTKLRIHRNELHGFLLVSFNVRWNIVENFVNRTCQRDKDEDKHTYPFVPIEIEFNDSMTFNWHKTMIVISFLSLADPISHADVKRKKEIIARLKNGLMKLDGMILNVWGCAYKLFFDHLLEKYLEYSVIKEEYISVDPFPKHYSKLLFNSSE